MKKPLIKSLMTKQKKLRSYRCPVAFHFSAKSVDCHLSVQFLSFLHPDDKQVVSLFSDTNCINAKKAVLSETNTYAAASREDLFWRSMNEPFVRCMMKKGDWWSRSGPVQGKTLFTNFFGCQVLPFKYLSTWLTEQSEKIVINKWKSKED